MAQAKAEVEAELDKVHGEIELIRRTAEEFTVTNMGQEWTGRDCFFQLMNDAEVEGLSLEEEYQMWLKEARKTMLPLVKKADAPLTMRSMRSAWYGKFGNKAQNGLGRKKPEKVHCFICGKQRAVQAMKATAASDTHGYGRVYECRRCP